MLGGLLHVQVSVFRLGKCSKQGNVLTPPNSPLLTSNLAAEVVQRLLLLKDSYALRVP